MTAAPNRQAFVVEIEQELLGAVLLGGDVRQASFLRAEHFVEPFHALLFDAAKTAAERYGAVKYTVVRQMMNGQDAEAFERKTGMKLSEYMAGLVSNCVGGIGRIEASARNVVYQWARLKLAEEAGNIAAAAVIPAADPAKLISEAGRAFDGIASDLRTGRRKKTRRSLDEAVEGAFAATQKAMETGRGLTGISWGLSEVNRVTGGMQRRDMTLVAARPGMGKTTFALSIGWRAARTGVGVGFLSLEMDAEKLAARAISDMIFDRGHRIPYTELIRGTVKPEELDSIMAASADFNGLPLWIDDQAGVSMTDVKVKTELLIEGSEKAGNPLGVLIIDHLGLIRAGARYAGSRVNEIGEMTAELKALAREHDIAVVLLSQLNRALEGRDNKRPQLSDLRDSGAIEQDADMIAFLYRESYYLEREKGGSADKQAERTERLVDSQNKMEFTIAKQRNGPLATIELFADMGCSAVRDMARH